MGKEHYSMPTDERTLEERVAAQQNQIDERVEVRDIRALLAAATQPVEDRRRKPMLTDTKRITDTDLDASYREYKFVIYKPYLDYQSAVHHCTIYGPETPLPADEYAPHVRVLYD